jgi:hypothetical protein
MSNHIDNCLGEINNLFLLLFLNIVMLKGTVSPDFKVFFIIYDIKSVLCVWTLMVLNFFYSGFILIFKDEVLMYMAQSAS